MHAWFKIGEMRAGSYPGKIDLKEEEYSKLEDSILTFKTDIVEGSLLLKLLSTYNPISALSNLLIG